jgi:hypothetical protein
MLHLLAAAGILDDQPLGCCNSCGTEISVLHDDELWKLTMLYFLSSRYVILLLSVDRMPGLNALYKLSHLQISFGLRTVELLTIHKIISSSTGMEFVVSPYPKHFPVSAT